MQVAKEAEVLTNLFTIVVPIHRAINGLSEMIKWLDEVLENSIPAFVIVVADSCEETTLTLLMSLSEKYGFDLVSCEYNSPGAARNLGLKYVTTDWVVFWDSDDVGCPCNVQLAIMAASDSCQAIIGTYEIFDRDTAAILKVSRRIENLNEVGVDPGLWRIIFRVKRIIGHNFISTKMGEDQLFLASVNLNEDEVMFSDILFYKYYCGSSEQLTKNKSAVETLVTTISEFNALLRIRNLKLSDYVYVLYCRLLLTGLKNRVMALSQILKSFRQFSIKGMLGLVRGMFNLIKIVLRTNRIRSTQDTTVIMTGGLGNQLFQLAAAMNLTKGIINLEVDVLKPRKTDGALDLGAFSLPPKIQIKASTGKSKMIATKAAGYLLRSGIYSSRIEKIGLINKSLKFLGGFIIHFYVGAASKLLVGQGSGYTELVPANGSTLIGYFQSYRYIIDPEIQRKLMALKPKQLSAEARDLIREASLTSPIFVHYRLTDYTSESKFGLPDENYYTVALDVLIDVLDRPIWVFSDDLDLAQARFPSERIEQAVFIDTKGLTPAEVLHVMRHGKGYVIANSSFSWWAATLRFDRTARVIAPKPWFRGQEEPKDLIFPTWERIGMSKT